MTTPLNSVTAAAQTVPTTADTTGTTSAGAADPSVLSPQAFLQLLVAQLKYQDPSNPVDMSSFMQQTATLSQVQTMTTMNTTLSSLADAQESQAAIGLIGKSITYLDSSGNQVSGVVGSAALTAGGATLNVGGASVPLSSVVEVTSSASADSDSTAAAAADPTTDPATDPTAGPASDPTTTPTPTS